MQISFERESYLRVTEVLSPWSGLHFIDPIILQRAADRGTRVHSIIDGIIQGFGEPSLDEDASEKGYVESFKKWFPKDAQIVSCEERLYDDDLKITGKYDLIYKSSEGTVLVDFKTSSKESKTWALQGSAYAHLSGKAGLHIDKILFVHLLKTGKEPKLYVYNEDFSLFENCLRLYKYFYAGKSKEDFLESL